MQGATGIIVCSNLLPEVIPDLSWGGIREIRKSSKLIASRPERGIWRARKRKADDISLFGSKAETKSYRRILPHFVASRPGPRIETAEIVAGRR